MPRTQRGEHLCWLSRGWGRLTGRRVPEGAVADHGVEDAQELAGGGDQGELLRLVGRQEVLVEGADGRVPGHPAPPRQGEGAPRPAPPAPDRGPPARLAAPPGAGG